jgi:hypothetical protein
MSQHHHIKRFRLAAALTESFNITNALVFAKRLYAWIGDEVM